MAEAGRKAIRTMLIDGDSFVRNPYEKGSIEAQAFVNGFVESISPGESAEDARYNSRRV